VAGGAGEAEEGDGARVGGGRQRAGGRRAAARGWQKGGADVGGSG
jgi:hypothetical protein